MKKIGSCLFIIVLLAWLPACINTHDTITMMVPFGSPQLAQLYMQDDHAYAVDVVQGADPLIAAFSSNSHDVIMAPVNLGAKLYQSGAPYVLLAVVTWGNLYLASIDQPLADMTDLEGRTVVAFGQNQPPDIVLRHLLMASSVTVDLTYVDSVANATAHLVATPGAIVLVAEPSLSALMMQYPALHLLDLQAAYEDVEGTSSYPQAGVFVKSDIDEQTKARIKTDLEQSINLVNDDPEAAATLAAGLGIDMPHAVLVSAMPRSHLRFVPAAEARLAVLHFLTLFNTLQPAIFDGWLPDDGFFDA